MGHWAMSCSHGNEDVDTTCDHPPAHAVRHLISMTFSCLKGLGLASFPLHQSQAQGNSAQEESLPTSLPASHSCWPCCRRGPEPCALGAARGGPKSTFRAAQSHAQRSNRPLGQTVLEAQEIHRLTTSVLTSVTTSEVFWVWSRVGMQPRRPAVEGA